MEPQILFKNTENSTLSSYINLPVPTIRAQNLTI